MSKAKDKYSKQVDMISFTSHYSTGPIVNYVTELEKKVEMFDEMLELLIQIDLWGMCPRKKIASINLIGRLDHVYMNESGNYVCEDIENILGRAKKIQEDDNGN